jgi:hypothetical protein
MFPVLAEHEINVITQRNQQNLAKAERNSMIRSLEMASAAPSPAPRPRPHTWTRLNSTISNVFHLVRGGHRPFGTNGRAAV